MDKRPKRRKYKDNPYNLESVEALNLYLVSFKDSKGIKQTVKVTIEVFNLFNEFELKDLSQMNEYDNHIEHINLEEEQIYLKSKNKPKKLEDEVIEKINIKELMNEIKQLPKIQRERFIKYYFDDMSYEEIAKKEGCSGRAVKYSVDRAFEKILKKLKF